MLSRARTYALPEATSVEQEVFNRLREQMVAARDTVLAAGDAIADVYASMITAAPLAEN